MTTTTDAQLVSAYLSGDRTALATIYDRYAPGLYDTARSMLSDRHDASDMVQDVFVIAAERLDQLREPDRLKPWLYAVLRNEVYRRTKKRKRAVPTDFQSETVPDVPASYDPREAGEAVAYEELASMLRSASAGLDERDRLVLELSVRQGLSGSDLADALGVTAEQSYSLVHRMRERVEKSLGAYAVAKAGRRDCPDLDRLLAAWDGEFTILIRKRVNRHIEVCATCDRSRKTLAPLALFGAAPAFVLPFGLRDRVLAATANVGPGASSGSGTSGSSGSSTNSTSRLRFDSRTGFPRAARLGRRALFALIGSSVAVVAVVGGVLVAQQSDDGRASDTTSGTVEVVASSDTAVDSSVAAVDNTIDDTIDNTTAGVVSSLVPTPPPPSGGAGGSGSNTGAGGPPAAPTDSNTPLAPAGSTVTTTSIVQPATTQPSGPAPSPATTTPAKTTTTTSPPKTTTTTTVPAKTTTTTSPPKTSTTTTTAPPKTSTTTTTTTTTTTAAPQRTLVLSKVAGTFPSCTTLGVQGVVTTTETGIQVFGEVEFFNKDNKTLGVRQVKLALASASTWRGSVTDAPTGAVTARFRLTARSTSGLTSTAEGSATQANKC
ncbi:MAG: sigma-70 family RNA polymerase sigma factor [Actinomycetota bacterium]